MYPVAFFCLLCLAGSLLAFDSCSFSTQYGPLFCDRVRRTGTLLVICIALLASSRVCYLDELVTLFLVIVIGIVMLMATPSSLLENKTNFFEHRVSEYRKAGARLDTSF